MIKFSDNLLIYIKINFKMKNIVYWQSILSTNRCEPYKADIQNCLRALENGNYKEVSLEKLSTPGYRPVYSARFSQPGRIIFTTIEHKGQKSILLLDVLFNHEYDKCKFLDSKILETYLTKLKEEDFLTFDDNASNFNEDTDLDFFNSTSNQQYSFNALVKYHSQNIFLDSSQNDLLTCSLPSFVQGVAGSGKTCSAFGRLLNEELNTETQGDVLYISLSERLVNEVENEFKKASRFLAFSDFDQNDFDNLKKILIDNEAILEKILLKKDDAEILKSLGLEISEMTLDIFKTTLFNSSKIDKLKDLLQKEIPETDRIFHTVELGREYNQLLKSLSQKISKKRNFFFLTYENFLKKYMNPASLDKGNSFNLVTIKHFKEWFQNKAKTKKGRIFSEKLPIELMMAEARFLSGSISSLAATNSCQESSSCFYLIENKSIQDEFQALFQEYQENLKQNKLINIDLTTIDFGRIADFIILDEAQAFSGAQLEVITKSAQDSQVMYCYDQYQNLVDGIDHLHPFKQRLQQSLGPGRSLNSITLTTGHRCTQIVSTWANNCLDLRAKISGKEYAASSSSRLETMSEGGRVEWINETTNFSSSSVKGFHADDASWAIVVGNTELKNKAKIIFNNSLNIYTQEEIRGLEFKNIILYQPFSEKVFKEIQSMIGDHAYGAVKYVQLEDTLRHNYRIALSKLFTSSTRSQENLFIVSDSSSYRILHDKLLAGISSSAAAAVTEEAASTMSKVNSDPDGWFAIAKHRMSNNQRPIAEDIIRKYCPCITFDEFQKFDTYEKVMRSKESEIQRANAAGASEQTGSKKTSLQTVTTVTKLNAGNNRKKKKEVPSNDLLNLKERIKSPKDIPGILKNFHLIDDVIKNEAHKKKMLSGIAEVIYTFEIDSFSNLVQSIFDENKQFFDDCFCFLFCVLDDGDASGFKSQKDDLNPEKEFDLERLAAQIHFVRDLLISLIDIAFFNKKDVHSFLMARFLTLTELFLFKEKREDYLKEISFFKFIARYQKNIYAFSADKDALDNALFKYKGSKSLTKLIKSQTSIIDFFLRYQYAETHMAFIAMSYQIEQSPPREEEIRDDVISMYQENLSSKIDLNDGFDKNLRKLKMATYLVCRFYQSEKCIESELMRSDDLGLKRFYLKSINSLDTIGQLPLWLKTTKEIYPTDKYERHTGLEDTCWLNLWMINVLQNENIWPVAHALLFSLESKFGTIFIESLKARRIDYWLLNAGLIDSLNKFLVIDNKDFNYDETKVNEFRNEVARIYDEHDIKDENIVILKAGIPLLASDNESLKLAYKYLCRGLNEELIQLILTNDDILLTEFKLNSMEINFLEYLIQFKTRNFLEALRAEGFDFFNKIENKSALFYLIKDSENNLTGLINQIIDDKCGCHCSDAIRVFENPSEHGAENRTIIQKVIKQLNNSNNQSNLKNGNDRFENYILNCVCEAKNEFLLVQFVNFIINEKIFIHFDMLGLLLQKKPQDFEWVIQTIKSHFPSFIINIFIKEKVILSEQTIQINKVLFYSNLNRRMNNFLSNKCVDIREGVPPFLRQFMQDYCDFADFYNGHVQSNFINFVRLCKLSKIQTDHQEQSRSDLIAQHNRIRRQEELYKDLVAIFVDYHGADSLIRQMIINLDLDNFEFIFSIIKDHVMPTALLQHCFDFIVERLKNPAGNSDPQTLITMLIILDGSSSGIDYSALQELHPSIKLNLYESGFEVGVDDVRQIQSLSPLISNLIKYFDIRFSYDSKDIKKQKQLFSKRLRQCHVEKQNLLDIRAAFLQIKNMELGEIIINLLKVDKTFKENYGACFVHALFSNLAPFNELLEKLDLASWRFLNQYEGFEKVLKYIFERDKFTDDRLYGEAAQANQYKYRVEDFKKSSINHLNLRLSFLASGIQGYKHVADEIFSYKVAVTLYQLCLNTNSNDKRRIQFCAHLKDLYYSYIFCFFENSIQDNLQNEEELISWFEIFKKMWNFAPEEVVLEIHEKFVIQAQESGYDNLRKVIYESVSLPEDLKSEEIEVFKKDICNAREAMSILGTNKIFEEKTEEKIEEKILESKLAELTLDLFNTLNQENTVPSNSIENMTLDLLNILNQQNTASDNSNKSMIYSQTPPSNSKRLKKKKK